MPLVKRLIEPVYICRGAIDKQVWKELEGVTINSLAGIIKQLSFISKNAEDLLGDLINEAESIYQRSTALSQRVQTLYEHSTQLDSAITEDVKVEEYSMMTHFKSHRQEEQQVLSPNTLPQALKEVYSLCDQPPELNKFNPYRDDGKDGIKFYSDRSYLYGAWVQQQHQLLKDKKKDDKRRRCKRRENNPTKKVQGVPKKKYASLDTEFVTADSNRETDPVTSAPHLSYHFPAHKSHPAGGPTPAPPSQAQPSAPTDPPPPPPPALMDTWVPPPLPSMAPSPSILNDTVVFPYIVPSPMQSSGPPIPLLPPNPMGMTAPSPAQVEGPPPPPGPAPPVLAPPFIVTTPQHADPRTDLLAAIKIGMKLREVKRNHEVKKQDPEYSSMLVYILQRRIPIQVSDTESESESESEFSSGSWSDS